MKYLKEKAWRTCEYYKENKKDVLVANITNNKAPRYIDKLEREYIDIPAIILAQQVLHGNGGYEYGAELVTENALVESANQWNNIPIVVYHTSESARTIENLEQEKVGFIYNAEIIGYDEEPSNIRLKCMLRLDVELLKLHEEGELIINTFDSGMVMEMSTGYYVSDWKWQEGSFRGRDYMAMQMNIIPDHLALLPNAIGAYSVKDGGGANRENEGEPMKEADKKEVGLLINEKVDERFEKVPTTDKVEELVGNVNSSVEEVKGLVDGLTETLNALTEKVNELEKQPEVSENEAHETLVAKAVKNSGLTAEELEGASDAILKKLALKEEDDGEIAHKELNKNEEGETMNPPNFMNNKEN